MLENVEILIPKFIEKGNMNPKTFVNKMQRYIDIKGIDNGYKLMVFRQVLDGDMVQWMEERDSYEEAREIFVKKHWGSG